jgi:hypothetical protein
MPIRLLPTSRRRRAYLLVALALIPLIVWTIFLLRGHGSFTRPDFDRIQTGMTLSEAEAVIDPSAEWKKLTTGARVAQYLIVWRGSDENLAGAIVTFVSGRVYSKEFSPPAPTSRDKARNWWYRNIGANPPF